MGAHRGRRRRGRRQRGTAHGRRKGSERRRRRLAPVVEAAYSGGEGLPSARVWGFAGFWWPFFVFIFLLF